MQNSNRKCRKDDSSGGNGSETSGTMTSTDFEKPFQRKFPCLPGEENLPCLENDYSRAKAYLMKQCLSSGDNLWDHLNVVLEKILIERPKDIACTFEEFSYKVRGCRFRSQTDHFYDVFVPPKYYSTSQKNLEILQSAIEEVPPHTPKEDEEEDFVVPNLMETFYYFEQGGVGLPKEEVLCLSAHLKALHLNNPILKYRFWGKILGTKKNYFIAETEVNEDELARINAERDEEIEKLRLEEIERETVEKEELKIKKESELAEAKEREIQFAAERSEAKYQEMLKNTAGKVLKDPPEKVELPPWPPLPPLPVIPEKKNVEVPGEPTGTGVNKKVYYVCNSLGDKWIQLPDVTPQQIVIARKIKRAFTGYLESKVVTYPSFPGKEKNLLRAQIARISAGTQISPLGYYTFNEEEEEEEEEVEAGESKTNYVINPDYEPVAIRDLVDTSMAFWVHHTQYILSQGRTTWWNPNATEEAPEEEEGEGEEEEPANKEVGPELLTPLSEDSALDSITPWTVRKTSNVFPEHSLAIVRSNLWPGAYAFAFDKKFDNIYIGDGQKFTAYNHSPMPLQEIQEEYPLGPEIMEIADPTPEQEEEWRLAHEEKKNLGEEGEEEEEANDGDYDDEDDEEDEEEEEEE